MMKTTVIAAALSFSILSSQTLQAQAIDLGDAIKKGYLTLSASGTGGHSGECLKLKLENKGKKKLEVRIPVGQVFEAGDSTLQNLMVAKEETFLVESGKSRIAKLFGFCVEAGDGSPDDGSQFRLGKMASGNLLKLAQHLSTNNLHQHPSAQFAVWAVTDEERLEGIGDPGLAKFVADLLGKPVPPYNIEYRQPQDRLLPGQPANLRDAVSMNGLFYYDLPKDQKVSFGLYDGEGKLIHALFSNRMQKRGSHRFKFMFEIRNLPKGKYFARLVSEGQMVKELEVEF
jgi:hypothetical protein